MSGTITHTRDEVSPNSPIVDTLEGHPLLCIHALCIHARVYGAYSRPPPLLRTGNLALMSKQLVRQQLGAFSVKLPVAIIPV